jgi:hemoglobin-like flavoprotein
VTLQESLNEILQSPKNRLGNLFYGRFLNECPAAREHFSGINLETQANILVNTLQVVVSHDSHRFPATGEYLKIIGRRHFQQKIPSTLYADFNRALLATLAEFHGPAWTPELAEAWRQALDVCAVEMLKGYTSGPITY